MAMWQVFFPPFSWFPSLENGLWNLHGAHRDTELGAQKGSHCSAPAACTSPQPPPAALPNPAGLPRHLPCWVFTPAAISSATLHRGLRETQLEKPSFWRAKRIIAWKPCRRVPGKETPRSTSLKSISPCTCTRGLHVGWKASLQADSCSTGNVSLKTVVSQALSQHSHRAKRWRRELGQHSPLAVVQSSCKGS